MQGKVLPERSATQVYVGIDVCKAKLDVYIHPLGLRYAFANDAQGVKRLKRCLEAYEVARVVMEATGKFHRAAHRSLDAGGFAVAVVNPLRSRLFAEAVGALAKAERRRLPNAGHIRRKPRARRERASRRTYGRPARGAALPRRRPRRPNRPPRPARRDDGSPGRHRDRASAPRRPRRRSPISGRRSSA